MKPNGYVLEMVLPTLLSLWEKKKKKGGTQFSVTPLCKIRTGTCLMILISRLGRGDAEIKSNHCLYYIFSSTLFTQEKMVSMLNSYT